ncbi:MAG: hypothetical protein ACREPA_07400 [Candidatus Dormibacteraceae bacterium]
MLEWLAGQPFTALLEPYPIAHGTLLQTMEHIVVENHRRLFGDALQQRWTAPRAYRWLRYESPEPVARLIDGTRRLEERWDSLWAERKDAIEPAARSAIEHEAKHLTELLRTIGGEHARGL